MKHGIRTDKSLARVEITEIPFRSLRQRHRAGLRLDIYNWPPGLYFWGKKKMVSDQTLKTNSPVYFLKQREVGSTLDI